MWHLIIGLGTIFVIGAIIIVMVCLQLPTTMTPAAALDIEIAKAALTGCIVAVLSALIKAREQRVHAARLQADIWSHFLLNDRQAEVWKCSI